MATTYGKDERVILPREIFIGYDKAPITLTQFGDYECETTQQHYQWMKALLDLYPAMVRFNYRHFPQLAIHQRAHKAAEASIAAAQAGKFREMHEMLLCNRRNLGVASLCGYARELGIGGINFLDALVSGRYGQYVQNDLGDGRRLGIMTAPAIFINGQRLTGRLCLANIREKVEDLYRQFRRKKTAGEKTGNKKGG